MRDIAAGKRCAGDNPCGSRCCAGEKTPTRDFHVALLVRLPLVGRFVVAWVRAARDVSMFDETIALLMRFSVVPFVRFEPLVHVNIWVNFTVDIHIWHQAGVLPATMPLREVRASIMDIDWR